MRREVVMASHYMEMRISKLFFSFLRRRQPPPVSVMLARLHLNLRDGTETEKCYIFGARTAKM